MTDINDDLNIINCDCEDCLNEKKFGTKSSYIIQTGRRGPIGLDGPTGPKGEAGLRGLKGEIGPTGPAGQIISESKRIFSQFYFQSHETLAKLYYFESEIISRLVLTGHNDLNDSNIIIQIINNDEVVIEKQMNGQICVLDLSYPKTGNLDFEGGILEIKSFINKKKYSWIDSLYLELKMKLTEGIEEKAIVGIEEKAIEGIEEKAIEEVEEKAIVGVKEKATEEIEEKATEEIEEKATEGIEEKATEGIEEKATEGIEEKATEGIEEKATEATEGIEEDPTNKFKKETTEEDSTSPTNKSKEKVIIAKQTEGTDLKTKISNKLSPKQPVKLRRSKRQSRKNKELLVPHIKN